MTSTAAPPSKPQPSVPATTVAAGAASIVHRVGPAQLRARTPSGTDSSAQTPRPSLAVAGTGSQARAARGPRVVASTQMVRIGPALICHLDLDGSKQRARDPFRWQPTAVP